MYAVSMEIFLLEYKKKYLNHKVILAQNSNVLKLPLFLFSDKMKVEQDYDVKDFIRNGETRKVCLSF